MANSAAALRNIQRGIPNPALGRVANLLRSQMGPGTRIFEELAKFSKDTEYWREDFFGATAAEAVGSTKVFQYAEANAGATDVAKLTPTTADPSSVTLATTANAGYYQNLIGPKMLEADHDPWIEVRFKIDTVTKSTVTIGLVDAVPASAAVIVSDIDTPAFAGGIADAAVYSFDLGQTLKTAALVTIGTSTAAGATTAAPTAAPYGIPTASTFLRVRVELRGDKAGGVSRAYCFVNDSLVAERAGPDGGKLLTPVFFHGPAVDGTGVTSTIDYIEFGQSKPGAPF